MVFKTFQTADYAVFAASLAISLLIGVIFMIIDWRKKRQNTDDFLMGGQNMNPIAVGFSLSASLMNAIFLIGAPAEIHYYTTTYALIGVAWVPCAIIAAQVFVPLFRRIRVISCYEYLELRFNAPIVRIAASLVFSLAVIFFLAVVLYAPAVAIMQVTGLDKTITICVCGVVCLIYVFMGGMKAVIWTDFVQMLIMIGGMLALTIKGTIDAGGANHVYEYALNNSRINFDVWDPDPRTRHTFWTQAIGQIFIWAPLYGSNQMMVQRYHSVKNARQAQIAVYASILVSLLMLSLVTMLGLVMYDYYSIGDPLVCRQISKGDQLVPYFLMEVLGDYPGVPGLFIAAVFAAALSSVSSALNSLAAVMLEDFIRPIASKCCGIENFQEKTALWISRLLAIFFGGVTIGLSFAAEVMGDKIIQIPMTIWGMVESPLYGVFVLANFFPCANAWGAMTGLIVSLVINFWQAIGSLLYKAPQPPTFPLGFNCASFIDLNATTPMPPPMTTTAMTYSTAMMGFTTAAAPVVPVVDMPPYALMQFYNMSYVWLGLLGLCTCIITGLIVSCITDGLAGRGYRSKKLDPTYIWPCADRCCCCFPEACLDPCRCGIDFDQDDQEQKDYVDKQPMSNGGMDNPTFTKDMYEMK